MRNKKRHLIITADESSWKFDRPVIFLGEWCRLHSRKHIWNNMDGIVARPYGLNSRKKDTDHKRALALEKKIFPKLCVLLNACHRTQHNEKYWRIVLGHWFRRIIDILINRVATLNTCFQRYKISGITLNLKNCPTLATPDSYSAIWACNDEVWNSILTKKLLEITKPKKIKLEILKGNKNKIHPKKSPKIKISLKKQILKILQKINKTVSNYFCYCQKLFIINSYLPLLQEVKLNLAFGQWPAIWKFEPCDISAEVNLKLRKKLFKKIYLPSSNIYEKVLLKLIFELIPCCYLENYKKILNETKRFNWPNKPKWIFTSNNFDTDESFKIWAASKIESGSQYIIGQHGNNYGTYRYMNPSVEEVISDKFITWGWRDSLLQHKPAFVLKNAGKKYPKYNRKGGLLLVEVHQTHRINTWDTTYEFIKYFEDQKQFVSNLSPEIKDKLIIRLHPSSNQFLWNEIQRWNDFNNNLKIETGKQKICSLAKDCRLIVFSYDSTGFLEFLSQNIPTLAFWRNGLEHLRESAKKNYSKLIKVGLIHFSAASAARHISKVWQNIDPWWNSRELQAARTSFCNEYAKTSRNPIKELKKIILEN